MSDRTARAAWCRAKGISMVEIEFLRPLTLRRWGVEVGERWWVRAERIDDRGDVDVDGTTVSAHHFRIVDRCGPQ